jgi:hypothetical protein
MNRFAREIWIAGLFQVVSAGTVMGQASIPAKPELLDRDREITMALSAAPAHLRDGAGVYVLESNGFVKARDSRNGFTCIVNRDHPLNLKPTCYDAEGARTILPKVIQVGQWLREGRPMPEISGLVKDGFKSGRFVAPQRPGIAYMLSGEIRNFNPQTGKAESFPPHVMFYAPNLTDADIGSAGGNDGLPFIGYQGPHGYMIMLAQNQRSDSTTSASNTNSHADSASYQVQVTNTMPHVMQVLFKDSVEHPLGSVNGGEVKTFTIVGKNAAVTLIGREPNTGTDVTQDVTLRTGAPFTWSF